MSTHNIFEYLVNSLWQLPLLALATWLVVRIVRPSLLAQHALWCATLALGVLLPLRGIQCKGADATQVKLSPVGDDVLLSQSSAHSIEVPKPSVSPIVDALPALRIHPLHLQSRTMDWLIDLYAVSVAFSLARFVHGWIAVRRMADSAVMQPLTTLESTLLRGCAERLQLAAERIPEVRFMTDQRASPMVVGVRHPILLLPENLRHNIHAEFDDAALAAVLLHELSHVQRRDFLANIMARIVAMPISYHPATAALQARIRQTREMICDSKAAGAFSSRSKYARSLLALAEGIAGPPQPVEAVGLFDHTRNSLEERIMKLTEPKLPLSLTLRAARIAAGTAVLIAGTGTAATMHLQATAPVVYAMQAPQSAAAPVPEPVPMQQAAAPAPEPAPAPTAQQEARPAPKPERVKVKTDDAQEVGHLSAEERKQLDEQMVVVRDQMQNLKVQLKDMKPIVIPKIDLKIVDSPEFKKQMAEIKIQFDSPEFKKQMEDLKVRMESGEFKKQMEEASAQASKAALDSGEFKKQMDEVNRQINSPEFKQQIEDARKMALTARADALRHSSEARKQLDDASTAIAEARKQVHDESVQRQLDEAQRRIEQAKKNY
jgi:beta-lactamase regulating signal transducer with metallopeptidase domain